MIVRVAYSIQRLTVDDLPECLALAQDRGWPPEERKWRLLLELGNGYGVRDQGGELVGSAVLTCFGSLAAIGMVVVAARAGGRGMGRALTTHAMAEAGDRAVFLMATEQGRPLYEKLGFEPVGSVDTYAGDLTLPGGATPGDAVPDVAPGGPGTVRPARSADLHAVRRLDAEVNGADRAALVDRLPAFSEGLWVVEAGGVVTGYAAAWRNGQTLIIGPVVAGTLPDAQRLISAASAGPVTGPVAGPVAGPVRVDLDGRHRELREWVHRHGLRPRFTTTVMVHGGRQLPGDRSRWFAAFMLALG